MTKTENSIERLVDQTYIRNTSPTKFAMAQTKKTKPFIIDIVAEYTKLLVSAPNSEHIVSTAPIPANKAPEREYDTRVKYNTTIY